MLLVWLQTALIIESYGMSLECHDPWCHLLASFLVEKDVKILWKCHDLLMEFNRIFMRKRHENVMKFQCHSMGLKILVHFDCIFKDKVHGIVMELDVIFDKNSDGMKWWHFIMRDIKSNLFWGKNLEQSFLSNWISFVSINVNKRKCGKIQTISAT